MRTHGLNEETIELTSREVACVCVSVCVRDLVGNDHADSKFSWNQLEVVHTLLPGKYWSNFPPIPTPLKWVLLLEDRTTTQSLNQSQVACCSIDHKIWLFAVSHNVRGHIYSKRTWVLRYKGNEPYTFTFAARNFSRAQLERNNEASSFSNQVTWSVSGEESRFWMH